MTDPCRVFRFAANPGPCCGKVLMWWDNIRLPNTLPRDDIDAVYENMGLIVDRETTWSTDISEYKLIIFPVAESDPSWWDTVVDGPWTGRIHMTAEWNHNANLDSIAYVDSRSPITGIGILGDDIDLGCPSHWSGGVEVDDMTDGMTDLFYAATSRVSGGTILARTETGAQGWISRNKREARPTIDWVISGDASHLLACANMYGTDNEVFLQNLWTAAI